MHTIASPHISQLGKGKRWVFNIQTLGDDLIKGPDYSMKKDGHPSPLTGIVGHLEKLD